VKSTSALAPVGRIRRSSWLAQEQVTSVATVEARHASYLNLLNRDVPFPAAFVRAVAPRRVCEIVREAFITSSPRPYGPYRSLGALFDRLSGGPTS